MEKRYSSHVLASKLVKDGECILYLTMICIIEFFYIGKIVELQMDYTNSVAWMLYLIALYS